MDNSNAAHIPESIRVCGIKLLSQARQVDNAQRVHDGAGNSCKVLQHGGVDDGLAVLEIRGNDKDALRLGIGVGSDDLGVGVLGGVNGEALKSLVDGLARLVGVDKGLRASPHVALGVGVEVQAGDNGKVVAAASQGPVQVLVAGLGVDVANGAVGEHHLVVLDVVASPAVAGRKEGYAATKCQAANADGGHSASDDSQVLGGQLLEHIVPGVACADRGSLLVFRERHIGEVEEINGHAVLDVGGARKGTMATTLDGKLALRDAKGEKR